MQTGNKVKKRFWTRERYLQILALLFVVALSVFIILNRQKVGELEEWGYLGVFLISIISSASIVLPVPGWILVATMAFTLNNPLLVGIVSGLGGTIGEMTGYLLGYGGRLAVENVGIYTRMVQWMKRWGSVTIFVLALIPNPFPGMEVHTLRRCRQNTQEYIIRLYRRLGFALSAAIAKNNSKIC
jgi:uncharacterized membrane protein YdjX (TVP38/TMEM64 family)